MCARTGNAGSLLEEDSACLPRQLCLHSLFCVQTFSRNSYAFRNPTGHSNDFSDFYLTFRTMHRQMQEEGVSLQPCCCSAFHLYMIFLYT